MTSIREAQDTANSDALATALRRAILLSLSKAAALADYTDRQTAVLWRARISELWERELSLASGPVYNALEDVRGKTVAAISRKLADLQPVISVQASASMPSIVWAYRLYEDATQATDLIERNAITHPSFMPVTFAARAPIANPATSASDRRLQAGI